ncbi:conserved exported protein of unknown function [Shinella sp. WSC3-e]|nr:conserved exported hypothetical protein [Rhizobiaceae bacterium]CAK7255217.1 conserved exported protein of unknown function [Shinella sp. WSC3-e]
MTGRMTRWAACLRILCAVALLSVGFAHQPASATAPTALELTQYVLPDGTLPDICLNDMVGGKAKHVGPVKCEACRIGSAMLMPAPADLDGAVLAFRRLAALPLVEEALRPRRERPGAPPRAPPFLSA